MQSGEVAVSRAGTRSSWGVAIVVILALAGVLRLIGLERYGFDGDEIFSVTAASGGWMDLLGVAARDVSHPPLFYMLLKLWLMIGPVDEAWVRLLPLLFGLGSLLVVRRICAALQISVADTALILLLMAVNGLLIYFSQHARMFSLLQFTSTLSLYYFIHCARGPITTARFVGVAIVDLVLVYSHYWGWLFLVGEVLAMLLISRPKALGLAGAAGCAAFGFVPWAVAVLDVVMSRGTATRQISWMGAGTPGISDYVWIFGELNGGLSFQHSTILGIILYGIPIAALIYAFVVGKTAAIDETASPLPWITLIATPLLMTSAVSYLTRQNLWGERHMIIIAAPYFILLALAFSRTPFRKLAVALKCLILLWALIAGTQALSDTHQKLDWKLIARSITARGDSPMVIYASEPFVVWPLRFHVARLLDGKAPVDEVADPTSITLDKFWFVYRNITWRRPETPEKLLEQRGYLVDHEVSTSTQWQTVTAMFAYKPIGAIPSPSSR